jgi:hypothetical protein
LFLLQGFTIDWCRKPDIGLPKPDLVLYLDLKPEDLEKRKNFGEERYEKAEFQRKVAKNYQILREPDWKVKSLTFYVVHTLSMSDFCIYPHSGVPQGLKGLILVKNSLREPWLKILPSDGAPLPPSLGHVTPIAIDQ